MTANLTKPTPDELEAMHELERAAKVAKRRKLPKWAQNELDRLERNVEHWKAKALAGPDESNTFADQYSDHGGSLGKPLGIDTMVSWYLPLDPDEPTGANGEWARRVDAKAIDRSPKAGHCLEVSGGDGLIVVPVASNVVRIYLAREDRSGF